MIIWDAELVQDEEVFLAVPGQITKILENAFEVATGAGKLRVNWVEYQGGNVAPGRNLVKSLRDRLI